MRKEVLLQFCKDHDIVVPANATVEYLNAAIVRAYLHMNKVEKNKSCFGFWAFEDNNCFTCDFEEKCFRTAIGTDKKSYFKKIESLENPRLRFIDKPLRKKK